MTPDPAVKLRSNRDFQVVLVGQSVSALGDAISITAMPLVVLLLTGSGAMMGLVGALELLPSLVLGLPAGALADRWDRRRLMLWTDAGQAILTAIVPLSLWWGWPTMTVILLVVVPINALRVLGAAGATSVVPSLVGREQLGRATGYLEASSSGAAIAGPAIAGVLVATVGPAAALTVNAVSFAISSSSLLLIRRPLRAERSGGQRRFVTEIREGIEFVWHHATLRMVVAYWSLVAVATAALLPALSYVITVDRGLGPALFGYVGSAWSIGYLAGALVGGRLGGRVGIAMLGAGGVIGGCLLALAAASEPLHFLVGGLVIGAALAVLLVSYLTLRGTVTPDALQGRVGATTRTITLGLQPLGLVAGGLIIETTSGATAMAVSGAVALGATLLFTRSRVLREAGRSAPDVDAALTTPADTFQGLAPPA